MTPVLSIILPAYNAASTLSRAVASVEAQRFEGWELILVDDGSTDGTAALARSFAERNPKIRVIAKARNEGLSAARNTGMAAAAGSYLTFLDADDWAEPAMYQAMLNGARGADIVITGTYHDALNGVGGVAVRTVDAVDESAYTNCRADILAWAARLDSGRLFAYTWNKLYRRAFLIAQGAQFEELPLIEDYVFNCRLWRRAGSIATVSGCYYHYVKGAPQALTRRWLPDYFTVMDRRYALMRELLMSGGLFRGALRAEVCTVHIKHLLAGMAKNRSAQAALSRGERLAAIRLVLADPLSREAMRYAGTDRRRLRLCNWIFRSRSPRINEWFAGVLYRMQKSTVFDRLK